MDALEQLQNKRQEEKGAYRNQQREMEEYYALCLHALHIIPDLPFYCPQAIPVPYPAKYSGHHKKNNFQSRKIPDICCGYATEVKRENIENHNSCHKCKTAFVSV